MTNAEKFKDIFGVSIYTVASICKGEYMACEFCKNDTCTAQWWNSEYKESTTKNDLGVDCISRAEAISVASGYCHPSNVAKELAKLPSMGRYDPYTDKFIKE